MWIKFLKYIPWGKVVDVTPHVVAKAQEFYQGKVKKNFTTEQATTATGTENLSLESINNQIKKLNKNLSSQANIINSLLEQNKQLSLDNKSIKKKQKMLFSIIILLCLAFCVFCYVK